MKLYIVLSVLLPISVVMSQRPTYAGSSPIGVPNLASRFKEDDADSSTSVPVVNRVGDDNSGTTIKIPVDARGDVNLVNRLNQWPHENKPFWLLNADHIEAHRQINRNQPNREQAQNQQQFGSRGSFNDFDYDSDTIPIRPEQPRSSFIGRK